MMTDVTNDKRASCDSKHVANLFDALAECENSDKTCVLFYRYLSGETRVFSHMGEYWNAKLGLLVDFAVGSLEQMYGKEIDRLDAIRLKQSKYRYLF